MIARRQRFGSLPRKRCESRVDLVAVACVESLDSQPHCAGGSRHLSQRCLGWGDSRVDEHGQIFNSRHQLKQEFQPRRCQFGRQVIEACRIAPRSGETINKTEPDRVFANAEDDWDRRRRRLGRQCRSIAEARDHGDPPSSQIGCHFRQLIQATLGPTMENSDVVALDVARVLQAQMECAQTVCIGG